MHQSITFRTSLLNVTTDDFLAWNYDRLYRPECYYEVFFSTSNTFVYTSLTSLSHYTFVYTFSILKRLMILNIGIFLGPRLCQTLIFWFYHDNMPKTFQIFQFVGLEKTSTLILSLIILSFRSKNSNPSSPVSFYLCCWGILKTRKQKQNHACKLQTHHPETFSTLWDWDQMLRLCCHKIAKIHLHRSITCEVLDPYQLSVNNSCC